MGEPTEVYDQDGLRTAHNHEFLADPEFQRAYARGVKAAGCDFGWHWRVHVGLWAASSAAKFSGDFVECGVGRGFMSSAIMTFLDWNRLGRRFYLLDTFTGIDERYTTEAERAAGIMARNVTMTRSHARSVDEVRRNFADWSDVEIVAGPIPDTLPAIRSPRIAFLHLDMNCSVPEVAAAEALWDRLAPGAFVLLDDYAYVGYESQKVAMDQFAYAREVSVLSLPTGQGLIVKPAASS
jgi:hypothetical protein